MKNLVTLPNKDIVMMKIIHRICKRTLYLLAAWIIKCCKKSCCNDSNHKKVLVLRLDAIGDAILWLDAAKEYRAIFPSDRYELTLLCANIWSSIAYELPYFDKVIPLNKKLFYSNFQYYFTILKDIRNAGYDIVINSSYSRDFIFQDTIVFVSGAERRIGSTGDLSNVRSWEKFISDRWYTQLIPSPAKGMMELGRNAEFMRGLGLGSFQSGIPQLPKIKVSLNIPKDKYYVIFPGASNQGRMWSQHNFSEIAKRICKLTGWSGVICGSAPEKMLGDRIIEKNSDCKLINMCGETSLPELAEIIRGARILVSNETSAVHFGAAVATPTVCILGGGHFGRFMPYAFEKQSQITPLPQAVFCKMECYQCNWKCRHIVGEDEPYPCISAVSVDQVWACVRNIIQNKLLC